jgi:hypothetical protein
MLAGYAVARAVLVPLTYDEAATYLRYIPQDFLSVFNFEVATNHFLNTLATKLATLIAGDSELVLRLPSLLLGCALYICFSVLLLRSQWAGARDASYSVGARPASPPQWTIAIAGLLLVLLNPYVFDFLALSRGYGISLGLLMGALYYLVRFASEPRSSAAGRDISRALMFGCGAVLANFSLLNAYLGIVAVVMVLGFQAARASQPRESAAGAPYGWGRVLLLPVSAAVFTFLVLSQDHGLTHRLYEPVTITFVGLDNSELDAVSVSRINLRRRPELVTRQPGASVWRIDPPVAVAGLRIELPLAAAEKISDGRAYIESIVGNRPFIQQEGRDVLWTARGAGATVVFESSATVSLPRSEMLRYEPVVNWRGDRNHLQWVVAFTAGVMVLLGVFAAALTLIGRVLERARVVTAQVWRPLMINLLWLGALAGPPLYVLRRGGELYYGGTRGFVDDTIYSLIESSFYGRTYVAAQSHIVFAAIVSAVAAFAIVGYLCVRRGHRQPVVAAGCLLGVMTIAAASVITQNWLLDTPFLINRTALFFIPLFAVFATFLLDAMARLGRVGTRLALAVAIVSATLAAAHFAVTANVTYAFDWRRDADTKQMIDDLARVIAAERPGSEVVLGVDWHYSAAAAFYAQKCRTAKIELHTIPATRDIDFFYVDERNAGSLAVIHRYPFVNSVLARPAKAP